MRWMMAVVAAGTLCAQVSEKARNLHDRALVFDGHVHVIDRQLYHGGDIGERVSDGQFDLPRAKEGGVGAMFFSVFVTEEYYPQRLETKQTLRLIDRDYVEPSNLQRQALFDEEDARTAMPKAKAAEAKLRRLNSGIAIEAVVSDLTPGNIEELLAGYDLILDGTDGKDVSQGRSIRLLNEARSLELARAGGRWAPAPCIRCSLTRAAAR